jgi:hypothetical protein
MSRLLYMSLVVRPAITDEHAERDECVLVIDGFSDSVECVSDCWVKNPAEPRSQREKPENHLFLVANQEEASAMARFMAASMAIWARTIRRFRSS